MQQADVIFRVLLPADEDSPEAAAIERYREAVEINLLEQPRALLSETADRDGAYQAFPQALRAKPR